MAVSAGEIQLRSLTVNPGEVTPGGIVEVTADIIETAEFIGPFDNDLCNPEGLNPTGLKADIELRLSWAGNPSHSTCVPVSQLGTGSSEVVFTLNAPTGIDPGMSETFTISAKVMLPGSGKESELLSRQFRVTNDQNIPDDPNDRDRGSDYTPPGNNNNNGGDDQNGDNPVPAIFAAAFDKPVGALALTFGGAVVVDRVLGD